MNRFGVTDEPILAVPLKLERYRVTDSTQVNLDGVVHEGGSIVELNSAAAERWLTAGWITPEAEPQRAAKKATPTTKVVTNSPAG